jgi:hypothetical protein
MEPVELSGQFVAIRPLSEEHAVGLLAADYSILRAEWPGAEARLRERIAAVEAR